MEVHVKIFSLQTITRAKLKLVYHLAFAESASFGGGFGGGGFGGSEAFAASESFGGGFGFGR